MAGPPRLRCTVVDDVASTQVALDWRGQNAVMRTSIRAAVLTLTPALLLAGCSSGSTAPTPSPLVTGSSTPSATPLPSATSTATAPASASTSPTRTASASPTVPAGGASCQSSQLSIALTKIEGAAGSTYSTFGVRNSSSTSCRLEGYFGLEPRDGQGRPIPVQLVHVAPADQPSSASPRSVLLSAGASATFQTRLAKPACQGTITMASTVAVTPPTGGAALLVSAAATNGSGRLEVCSPGQLMISFVYPAS